jgi:hypothetical protein
MDAVEGNLVREFGYGCDDVAQIHLPTASNRDSLCWPIVINVSTPLIPARCSWPSRSWMPFQKIPRTRVPLVLSSRDRRCHSEPEVRPEGRVLRDCARTGRPRGTACARLVSCQLSVGSKKSSAVTTFAPARIQFVNSRIAFDSNRRPPPKSRIECAGRESAARTQRRPHPLPLSRKAGRGENTRGSACAPSVSRGSGGTG